MKAKEARKAKTILEGAKCSISRHFIAIEIKTLYWQREKQINGTQERTKKLFIPIQMYPTEFFIKMQK